MKKALVTNVINAKLYRNNNGSHPDVIEIDAASNNGVDDVRDLIEKN